MKCQYCVDALFIAAAKECGIPWQRYGFGRIKEIDNKMMLAMLTPRIAELPEAVCSAHNTHYSTPCCIHHWLVTR